MSEPSTLPGPVTATVSSLSSVFRVFSRWTKVLDHGKLHQALANGESPYRANWGPSCAAGLVPVSQLTAGIIYRLRWSQLQGLLWVNDRAESRFSEEGSARESEISNEINLKLTKSPLRGIDTH